MIQRIAGFHMPPIKLPPEHHIVRYVPWAKLRKDEMNPDRVVGVLGEAFRMRPAEDTLSTTWLQYFAGTRQQQIHAAIRAMRASRLAVKPRSGFVIGKVGSIADAAAAHSHSIRVLHEPEEDNRAHAAVRRWPREALELFELLAAEAWSELVLNGNSDIPPGEEAAPGDAAWAPAQE